MDKEKRFEELASHLDGVDEAKKPLLLSLLKDFVFIEEKILELRKLPLFVVNPKDPTKQLKLPAHDMLKDFQAQKNDITTKILRTLVNDDVADNPLMKALARFSDD